jgi:hypothetical protein
MNSFGGKGSKGSSMLEILEKCRVRVLQKDNTVVSAGAGGLNK